MKFKIADFLSNVFLFKNLSSEELSLITSFSSIKNLKRGQLLFSQGEDAHSFYIIAFGKLKVYCSSSDGEEQLLHILSEQEIVAEAAIFACRTFPASCVALKDSLLVRIPRQEFISLIEKNPSLSLKFLTAYSYKLREFVSMIEYLSLDDAHKKILRFLLKESKKVNGKTIVSLSLKKKEIAQLLGIRAETFSRMLNKLKNKGIISEYDGVIEIKEDISLSDLSG